MRFAEMAYRVAGGPPPPPPPRRGSNAGADRGCPSIRGLLRKTCPELAEAKRKIVRDIAAGDFPGRRNEGIATLIVAVPGPIGRALARRCDGNAPLQSGGIAPCGWQPTEGTWTVRGIARVVPGVLTREMKRRLATRLVWN